MFVVFYHAGWLGIKSGYLGVDAFFVVSGYLITGLLLRELQERDTVSLLSFWARRIKRLLPAASLVIISVTVLSRYTLEPLRALQTGRDAVPAGTFWSNIHFWLQDGDYYTAGLFESPLRHYWSLSLEEQYYLILPVLLMVAWRAMKVRGVFAFLSLVTFASFLFSVTADQNSSFYLIQSRAWQLGVGGLLSISVSRGAATGRVVIARTVQEATWVLAAALLSVTMWGVFESKHAERVTVVIATAIMIATGERVRFTKALRPLEGLGTISYSLYLWHWPLFVMSERMSGKTEGFISDAYSSRILALSLALFLSYLTWRHVENLRWSHILSDRRRTYIIGLSSVVVAVSVGFISQNVQIINPGDTAPQSTVSSVATTVPEPVGASLGSVLKENHKPGIALMRDGTLEITDPGLAADRGAVKEPEGDPSYAPMLECGTDWTSKLECQTWGDYADPVLMVGDTEGWQWSMHHLAVRYGYKAVTFRGCPDPTVTKWSPECDEWIKKRALPSVPVIVSLASDEHMSKWIEILGGDKSRVAFISPISSRASEMCLKEASKYEECDTQAVEHRSFVEGALYFDTNKWLCATYCPGSIGGNPVSRGNTLTTAAALMLSEKLRTVVSAVSPESASIIQWLQPEPSPDVASELLEAVSGAPVDAAMASRLETTRNEYPKINSCRVGLPEGDPCIEFLQPEKPIVVLVGDSHAGQWGEVINNTVVALGGQTLITIGCKAMMQTEDTYNGTPECRGFEERLERFVRERKPVLIVASSKVAERGLKMYAVRGGVTGWISRQRLFWETIAPHTKNVLIIADNPLPEKDVPLCLSDNISDTRVCGAARWESENFYLKNAENKMAARLSQKTGANFKYIDVTNWVCSQDFCPPNTSKNIIYRDDNHLSNEYVVRIAGPVTGSVYEMYGQAK